MRLLNNIVIVLILMSSVVVGDIEFKDMNYPAGETQETIYNGFTLSKSISNVNRLKDILKEFTAITRLIESKKGKVTEKDLRAFKHTTWDVQTIGFSNLISNLKGTLLKQDYQIKKLTYELAIKSNKEQSKIKLLKSEFIKSEKKMQDYLDNFEIVD